jgi:hypothetical protein
MRERRKAPTRIIIIETNRISGGGAGTALAPMVRSTQLLTRTISARLWHAKAVNMTTV